MAPNSASTTTMLRLLLRRKASVLILGLAFAYGSLNYLIATSDSTIVGRPPGLLDRFLLREWPSISDVVDRKNNEIIGDAQFLLDFAIVGHGKCGTTSMQALLSQHPMVRCSRHEYLELTLGSPALLVDRMYRELPEGYEFKRGYKSPGEIRSIQALRDLDRYFPRTTLLVGIRHPVHWFESLYNFKVQNLRPGVKSDYWGDPNDLIGKCNRFNDFFCVGTAKGLFHVHLSYLGKVDCGDLRAKYPELYPENGTTPLRNPVILYDLEQLSDTNATRRDVFRNDVYGWLGLPPTSSTSTSSLPRSKPGLQHSDPALQADRDRHKIRICDPQHGPVREELMRMSVEIAQWILTSGLLEHPSVFVSSRNFFEEVLRRHWMKDPCTGEVHQSTGR